VRGSATVLSLQGQADYRENIGAPWQSIRVNQQLTAGQWLRTAAHGRMALLLSDRTQIRLNENTVLEVLAIGAKPLSAGQTKFRQLLGRSWVQSKSPPQQLTWTTPTGVAGIREVPRHTSAWPMPRSGATTWPQPALNSTPAAPMKLQKAGN
jgi:hypothetical protein